MDDMETQRPPLPPAAVTFNATQPVTINCEAQEWQIVLAGLNELPRRVSDAVFDKIMGQLTKAGR